METGWNRTQRKKPRKWAEKPHKSSQTRKDADLIFNERQNLIRRIFSAPLNNRSRPSTKQEETQKGQKGKKNACITLSPNKIGRGNDTLQVFIWFCRH
ncbi:hypothetical protein AVEN_253170-1 [Araneus ventricosus]|uniref:Uncharacterized protein n=1 Tax=Araneus ventricosus TaxID=182803 RepID=A0A4Y2HR20_ARAVE|nr:hypothetical protein AVEN_253170-1 [Araneus ventricosus]